MKNRSLFFKIILYWIVLLVAIIISVLLIEGLTEYRFDAQLGMAIVIWGALVSVLLAIMGGIHNLILDKLLRIKCNGCKEVINGEYIVFRPDGTEYKFNYCGKECRNEYHPQNMKGIGREWNPPSD